VRETTCLTSPHWLLPQIPPCPPDRLWFCPHPKPPSDAYGQWLKWVGTHGNVVPRPDISSVPRSQRALFSCKRTFSGQRDSFIHGNPKCWAAIFHPSLFELSSSVYLFALYCYCLLTCWQEREGYYCC